MLEQPLTSLHTFAPPRGEQPQHITSPPPHLTPKHICTNQTYTRSTTNGDGDDDNGQFHSVCVVCLVCCLSEKQTHLYAETQTQMPYILHICVMCIQHMHLCIYILFIRATRKDNTRTASSLTEAHVSSRCVNCLSLWSCPSRDTCFLRGLFPVRCIARCIARCIGGQPPLYETPAPPSLFSAWSRVQISNSFCCCCVCVLCCASLCCFIAHRAIHRSQTRGATATAATARSE